MYKGEYLGGQSGISQQESLVRLKGITMKRQGLHFRLGLLPVAFLNLVLWFAVAPGGIVKAGSEGSISGVVTDDAGKPLRGAPVTARLENMSVSRYTDASGKYQITGLKPGSYKISPTA